MKIKKLNKVDPFQEVYTVELSGRELCHIIAVCGRVPGPGHTNDFYHQGRKAVESSTELTKYIQQLSDIAVGNVGLNIIKDQENED